MLDKLLSDIRSCTLCASKLPHAPRPVLAASAQARILIVGQAPGARVHASGIPWSDASGTRLRAWLGVDDATFYDDSKFAIVPVGFCYPGRGRSGDLPPAQLMRKGQVPDFPRVARRPEKPLLPS